MAEPIIPRYDPLPPKAKRQLESRVVRGTPGAPGDAPPPPSPRRRVVPRSAPRGRWWRDQLSLRIGVRQLSFVCLQLEAYIDAGFPITEAWRHMGESTDHPRLRRLCHRVHRDLVAGKPLGAALAPHEGTVPRFFINMMTSAERSGSYVGVLRTLQDHYKWLFALKGEIIRALTYLISVILLGSFVMVIRDFILLGIADSPEQTIGWPNHPIRTLFWLIHCNFTPILVGIILAYAVTTAMREWKRLRAPVDFLGLTLPGIGGLIKECCVANFCRMYATQTESGLHPSNVYRDAAASVGNVAIERRLMAWKRFVDDGEPVSEALRRANLLTFETLALIETSEYTASASDVLPRVAEYLAEDVRHQMRAMVRLITPMAPFLIAWVFFGAAVLAKLNIILPFGFVTCATGIVFGAFFLIFLI